MIKYERISFTKNMFEGIYYNAIKVNKRICLHEEYKIANYEARRNANYTRNQAMKKCSHKKHKMVDLSI